MKLPRDIGEIELARKLEKYEYQITRQTGSHIRLSSAFKGTKHHVTIPRHGPIKIGTLDSILKSVALYLEKEKSSIIEEILKT
jgi:predicted RNA binding protein YcfA (HicA-like mRNA interferase family)